MLKKGKLDKGRDVTKPCTHATRDRVRNNYDDELKWLTYFMVYGMLFLKTISSFVPAYQCQKYFIVCRNLKHTL